MARGKQDRTEKRIVLLGHRNGCEGSVAFAPDSERSIDDLIRTGLIAKEQR